VVLQTFPRLFGFVFNPVQFLVLPRPRRGACARCWPRSQHLRLIHRQPARRARRPATGVATDRLRARKLFHVSPFFPVDGDTCSASRSTVPPPRRDRSDMAGEACWPPRVEGRALPLDA
jgi:hypothetical protein